ncbi:MAG: HK97 gp10 family phage protein [Amphritea sp.]|nr:HK97 gp10 family phage protein [Amphritea sp.]
MFERIEVEGLQDLERQLVALGAKDGLTALRRAGRAAMEPVKDQMERTAPFDERKDKRAQSDDAPAEHLRDSIKITSKRQDKRKGGKNNAITVRVGPSKKHAAKALWSEYGTEKQPAKPFMRPALYDNRHTALSTFKNKLAFEIARIIRRNQKKG